MTESGPARRPTLGDSAENVDARARAAGRDFLIHLYTALRSLRLYPLENEQVQRALRDLIASGARLAEVEGGAEVRVSGEFLFINGVRVRHDLDNYSYFRDVLAAFRKCGIGCLHIGESVPSADWQALVMAVSSVAGRDQAPELQFDEISHRLQAAGVETLGLEPPLEGEVAADEQRSKELAKRTYERSVAATKQLIGSVRMGRSATVRQVKRAVQGIVDQVLGNETSLIGLTAIRDYDEYTFTHSVNVCIFAVSIGRRLGLSKVQLYDLGMAALLHDIGKSRVSHEIINKTTALEDDEWRQIQAHPWLGVLTLFALRGYGELPYRSIIAAYEHHMKLDLQGYPRPIRERALSLFSKIVAVADGFDAATTRRSYQTEPMQPDRVLQEMWHNPRRGMDPVLVKGMINLLGVYPVGTAVLLDTYEIGVVHAVNPNPRCLNQPLVRVVVSSDGVPQDPGAIVDLAEANADGSFRRSILKVVDPQKYGIEPGSYFV